MEAIPHDRRLWSAQTIAAYADLSPTYVSNSVVFKADFPRPVKLEGKGHPRWIAGEVMAWFEGQRKEGV